MNLRQYLAARKNPPRPPGTLACDIWAYFTGTASDSLSSLAGRVLDRWAPRRVQVAAFLWWSAPLNPCPACADREMRPWRAPFWYGLMAASALACETAEAVRRAS